jgi:hypothetical protein
MTAPHPPLPETTAQWIAGLPKHGNPVGAVWAPTRRAGPCGPGIAPELRVGSGAEFDQLLAARQLYARCSGPKTASILSMPSRIPDFRLLATTSFIAAMASST